MKSVILRAPVLTQSGYGVHSRQILKWLLSKQDEYQVWIEALPWGSTPWYVDRKALGGLVEEIMKRTVKTPENFVPDISVQVQLPNEWNPNLAKFNVGVTAAVETDRCNPEWIQAINTMDLIIVPSEHVKKTLFNTGAIQKKVVVIPEAFIEEVEKEDLSHVSLPDFDTKFNFLVFGQITGTSDLQDRKNTFRTIKWLCESFKKNKDVGIVLKANTGRNTAKDRVQTKALVGNILKECRKNGEEGPPVYLLHGSMNDSEVAALYRHPSIKALVAFTRGEGYGLPILEAAASDLPIMATDWSGHLDFLNRGKFIKIDYELKEIDKSKVDGKLFMEGTKWAEPKETAAKKALKLFHSQPEKPQEWAKDLGQKIRENYSQSKINELYDKVFSEILIW